MSLTPKILSFAVLMALGGAAAAANTDSPAVGRALGLLQSHGAAVRASANDQFIARDVIVDADGVRHEVQGMGVVGHHPDLKPGERFEYSSFCPLNTSWGTMEGSYVMEREDGSVFDARIKRFFLVGPTS